MITRTALVCLLLLSSLGAQTKNTAPSSNPAPAQAEPSASAKIEPTKEADIRHLMQVMRMNTVLAQMMDTMSENIKPAVASSLPPGEYRAKLVDLFFEKFRAKANPAQIIEMAVPLYDKYFTDEEIKGLTRFYETPLGQKAMSALPQLTAEMQQAGMQWGATVGRQSMEEVLAEHPELADAMKAAAVKGKME